MKKLVSHAAQTVSWINMQTKEQALSKLKKSKFRASFHLSRADRDYINKRGLDTIRSHASDFVSLRLAPAYPVNDGRQTPMSGHPAFKAMHACACCCRGCLNKWYNVPLSIPLTTDQQERIVDLLITWIEEQ